MIEVFKKIEKMYAVEDVIFDNEQVWSFLRNNYFSKTIESVSSSYIKKKERSLFFRLKLKLSHASYGFKNWFRKYDYIFFSDSQERILVDGYYKDKSVEHILESHGYSKSLMIESPIPMHYSIEKVETKHIVSSELLSIIFGPLVRVVLLLKSKKVRLPILDKINEEEKLEIEYGKIILSFLIRKKLYKILFKIYKPKIVYVNCYYGKQEIIYAANELNIKTVEVQHGLIGREHYAYNISKKLDKKFFPHTLLCYGEYDKKIVMANPFVPFSEISPMGSYGLELLKVQRIPQELITLGMKYYKTVSISTQYTVEEELALFIKELAEENVNIGFFFSLRHYDKEYYKKFNMPNNVHLFYKQYSCYDILKVSDAHCTVYSTCAMEATYFKKRCILVNLNGMSKKFIEVEESSNLSVVENKHDFLETLETEYIYEENRFYKILKGKEWLIK